MCIRDRAHFEVAGGGSISGGLATSGGERGAAAVVVAPLPAGADADADQEPVGLDGQERGAVGFAHVVGEAPPGDRGFAFVGLVRGAAQGLSLIHI